MLIPRAREVICADLARDPLAGLIPGAEDFVVVLTRCHALDEAVLEAALGTAARYLGLIGSRRKIAVILRCIWVDGTEFWWTRTEAKTA